MTYRVLAISNKENNSVLLVELLEGIIPPTVTTPTPLSKPRAVDLSLIYVLESFELDPTRYRFLARTEWLDSTEHLRIPYGDEAITHTPRYPFWVYDVKEHAVKCFALAPQGKLSIHRYLGAAYGYPQCCIDSYVKINTKRKHTDSDVINDLYFSSLKGTGYLEFRKKTGFEPCIHCAATIPTSVMETTIKQHAMVDRRTLDNNEHSWLLLMYLYMNNRFKLWTNQTLSFT